MPGRWAVLLGRWRDCGSGKPATRVQTRTYESGPTVDIVEVPGLRNSCETTRKSGAKLGARQFNSGCPETLKWCASGQLRETRLNWEKVGRLSVLRRMSGVRVSPGALVVERVSGFGLGPLKLFWARIGLDQICIPSKLAVESCFRKCYVSQSEKRVSF